LADTRINEASWELVDSLHETNQAAADHFVAVLDSNLKFAQNLLLLGTEVMETQTKNTRHLMDQWTQQLPKQQKAFYENVARGPLAFRQRVNGHLLTASNCL